MIITLKGHVKMVGEEKRHSISENCTYLCVLKKNTKRKVILKAQGYKSLAHKTLTKLVDLIQ